MIIFLINMGWHGLSGNDVDILHEEIEYLVGHLVRDNVDILHKERIHLVEFSFIRVIDYFLVEKTSFSLIEVPPTSATLWKIQKERIINKKIPPPHTHTHKEEKRVAKQKKWNKNMKEIQN